MINQIAVTCPCCGMHFVVTRELFAPTSRRARDPDDEIEHVHAHPNDDLEERRGYHGTAYDDDVSCPNRGRLIR